MRRFLLPFLPILIAGILVLSNISIPNSIVNSVHTLASPIWLIRDSISRVLYATRDSLKSKETLSRENMALTEELYTLQRQNFLTKSLKEDNLRLQTLLGRTSANEQLLTASVIHDELFSPYDTFIVDIGADSGIRDGMLVLTPEENAIGVVTATLQKTATVTLFSAPTMTVDAVLNATTSFHTILRGYGSGTMRVSIPRDIEFSVGDAVLLPSFSTYPIGEIAAIEVAPQDAYKILFIRNPVNMYELRYVLIDTTTTWEKPNPEKIESVPEQPSSDKVENQETE